MSGITLSSMRAALDGSTPAVLATCAADGTPNVSYVSEVEYVDERHVALSFQFFSKTRANVLANPMARLMLIEDGSACVFRLLVQYLRTETEGPLFERLRARLAGIASQHGMAEVFRLRGADVYRVLAIERVPGAVLPVPPRPALLGPLRSAVAALAAARELDTLIDTTLDAVQHTFGIPHAMLLMHDAAQRRLYAVASRGYAASGVGAEVELGVGVIGVAGEVGVPIRIGHALAEHGYARVVRAQTEQAGQGEELELAIPLPGLRRPGSQLAVPVRHQGRLRAVLFVEDDAAQRFGHEHEDALAALADALALAMQSLDEAEAADAAAPPAPAAPPRAPARGGAPLRVRYHARHHTVFVDDDYLIKGVAGAILWKLLREHAASGRCEFSSRELRADSGLPLPELADNLAARLILLQRRLDERQGGLRLRKSGRGRVALEVQRPLQLDACA